MKKAPWNEILRNVQILVAVACVTGLCVYLHSGWPLVVLPFVLGVLQTGGF